ncbi:FHA domain-containing protein [Rhodococcus sp. IEGM 1379]|uniref:FHA domain-containing protein n=1 Tax=Rhodococcus sp. IEGM 1379 TaxID=3047086 RepID=UPI0024B69819|nr:FHA domain-containing protein [Rhodococcus sp. IEGM 1379]MDI9914254.1 FHA domain-containing protein [Rhodococcus sp. IEGM 1379]
MPHLYRPGCNVAVVGKNVVVVLEAGIDPSSVLAVYDVVRDGGGVHDVESRLAGVENFAVVPRSGDLVVCGRFRTHDVGGAVAVSQPGLGVWASTVQLPVGSGVVLMSEIAVAWAQSEPEIRPEPIEPSPVGIAVTEEWRGEAGFVDPSTDLVGAYDDMLGSPLSVVPAPPAASSTPPTPPTASFTPPAAPVVGDHDGLTSMWSQVLAPPPPPAAAVPPPIAVIEGPTVLARVCPLGHPNPPHRDRCRACGAPLEGESRTVPRPVLGSIRMSTGVVHHIERPASIGRQPVATQASGYDVPQLITVPNPSGDISRSHLALKVDGWHVLAVDLGSTNGSFLRRGGHAPQRLLPNDPVLLVDRDVVVLGDEVTLTFEGLS